MENLISVLLFAISTTLTPGPNNVMLMNSGLNYGFKRSIPHLLGVAIGFPIMFIILALGFGAIFMKYAIIKTILKILGSAYLLYLSYKILFSENQQESANLDAMPFTFMGAVLFQWVNPKAWLMAISAISLYSLSANYFTSAGLMGFLFFLVCIPCAGAWLWMGNNIKQYLKTDLHAHIFNFCMSAALVASVAMIIFEG